MDTTDLLALAAAFPAGGDGACQKSRELILHLLEHTPAPLDRLQFAPGHITCTGLVLSPDQSAVLLVHHARLDRWLLPGGHVEVEDASPADAARREVLEETAAVLDPEFEPFLVGMDVHGIPPRRGEPFHLHHDLVFAFRARTLTVSGSEESRAVEWVRIEDLAARAAPANVALSFRRTRELINSSRLHRKS
jgi:8-oxo-dGTP pyrophosphatase MutT (NUDIX family)